MPKWGTRVRSTANGRPIPPVFWLTMSDNAMAELLFRDGMFNTEECKRIWKLAEYEDEPPETAQLLISREDMERTFPRRK